MFIIYLIIGIITGIFSGLLGIGGGLIIVPSLLFVFSWIELSHSFNMHLAMGTSLISITLTTLASMYAHHGYRAIMWRVFLLLTPGLILGGFSGALLASILSDHFLQIIFSIFVFIAAAQIGIGIFKSVSHRQLPGMFIASLAGLSIGAIAALLGISGGSMVVPYLVWHNVPMRQAVATSAACCLPPAIASTIGYLISGWNIIDLPSYSTGFIYWPAFVGIVLTSTVFARVGAKLAHKISINLLKRVFAVFLCIIGAYILNK
jgi:uncharacterized membrane protein YfcA